jgi:hypothetical protein
MRNHAAQMISFLNVAAARLSIVSAVLLAGSTQLLWTVPSVFGAEPKARLVEIRDDSRTYLGKVVAKDGNQCFLMDQFGAMAQLPISRLQSFQVVSESYQPSSASAFRKHLQTEFAAGFEVLASSHYVVVGKKGRAKAYSALFEEIYRQVHLFYSVRGFELSAPEVPLIAIVFGTQNEFKEYCGKDQVLWSPDLRGYYSLKTNRVALFDDPGLINGITSTDDISTGRLRTSDDAESIPRLQYSSSTLAALLNSVAGETADTIVHETTHQVGYNIGIHSRIGETPTWVVEGLATVLEAPGMRLRSRNSGNTKLNNDRLNWFNNEYESRRRPGDLAMMIASDEIFRNQTLDAYSAAWAFSYFMTENPARAKLFVQYLKILSKRDPMKASSPEERLKDFQSVFGDISRMEVDFLRFIDRIEQP